MWRILEAAGVDPAPRRSGPTWRQFGSRLEVLDKILIVSEAHLRAVLAEYVAHCNAARLHQGTVQHVPDDDVDHPIVKVIRLETVRAR